MSSGSYLVCTDVAGSATADHVVAGRFHGSEDVALLRGQAVELWHVVASQLRYIGRQVFPAQILAAQKVTLGGVDHLILVLRQAQVVMVRWSLELNVWETASQHAFQGGDPGEGHGSSAFRAFRQD